MTVTQMKTTLILSKKNEAFFFRELARCDSQMLATFFVNLSDATRSRFGPHPLTMECANELCNTIDDSKVKRFVVLNDKAIAGYFILDFTPYKHEIARYQINNISLTSDLDPVFAPCIADKQQNSGIASQAMLLIINMAKNENLRRIVLMGGTQENNLLARSFYRKFAFKEYGTFYTDYNHLNNIDMMLTINPLE